MPKYKDCGGFISGLGSSVPQRKIAQADIGAFMKQYMVLDEKQTRWIDLLVKQSRIDYRHSVIPDYGAELDSFDFYPQNAALEPFPSVGRRMQYYKAYALPLAASAARKCLTAGGVSAAGITHLIVVSCTGMYAPGLDIDLVTELGLPGSVDRSCINFMGCYAAFNALKAASSTVKADKSAKVLIVCLELCSIHFQKNGAGNSHLLTNMLFSDGASAALVVGEKPKEGPALAILDFACDLFPEGKDEMTWEISDFGFAMKLTGKVSEVLKKGVGQVFERLLQKAGLTGHEIQHYAFHPGGPKVLEVLEAVCGITPEDNQWAHNVLRSYGNMSSATLFFILQEMMEKGDLADDDLLLSSAFGPGLTCESALMAVVL